MSIASLCALRRRACLRPPPRRRSGSLRTSTCKPTKHDLVYNCRIALKEAKSGKSVSGAEVSVGAEMPSMPMAHNVRPVKAQPGTAPGQYAARIELEMYGGWAMKPNVRGPARDVIVKKLDFREPR